MSRLLIVAAALALPALAQPAPEPGERTQRAADNPFRMIIEAAKIKSRKAGTDKPAAKAAPAGPAAPPAPAVVARPQLPPAEAASEATDDAPPVPLVVVEPPPRDQPESTVVTVEAAPVPLPPGAGPDVEPEATPPAAALPPLRLLEVVEPVTPRALIGQLRGEVRAQVSFTVAPDGLVREPRVDSISHPLMTSSVLQAVRQWRYQAIPEPRAHGVEIVLRQD